MSSILSNESQRISYSTHETVSQGESRHEHVTRQEAPGMHDQLYTNGVAFMFLTKLIYNKLSIIISVGIFQQHLLVVS